MTSELTDALRSHLTVLSEGDYEFYFLRGYKGLVNNDSLHIEASTEGPEFSTAHSTGKAHSLSPLISAP